MAVRRRIYRYRACRRSHISRAPFAPLGSGAHSAPAWVGWLLANFSTGSALLVFCSRVRAAAKHSVLTPSSLQKENNFLKSGFVRSPAYKKLKTHLNGGRQSFSRIALEYQQKGKFWVRAKFAFLHRANPPVLNLECQWWDKSV